MSKTLSLNDVSLNELYHIVQDIESIRDPVFHYDQLNKIGDYLHHQFENIGYSVSEQIFTVDGYDATFRNIIASNSRNASPQILLCSHYDSVPTTMGANDNASAIALQLQLAKLLVETEFSQNISFLSFSLEELNPYIWKTINSVGKSLGLYDEENRVKTWHYKFIRAKFQQLNNNLIQEGVDLPHSYRQTYDQLHQEMTVNEKELYKTILDLYPIQDNYDFVGHIGLIGSTKWVETALEKQMQIKYALNFDEIAMTSQQEFSQIFPEGLPYQQFPQFNVDLEKRVGNFISIFADQRSESLLFSLLEQSEKIQLPYLGFPTQMDYTTLHRALPDALHADHAPFWRANIPCVMITDWGEYRSPYAHTMADTADRLDYEFLRKVILTTYNQLHRETT